MRFTLRTTKRLPILSLAVLALAIGAFSMSAEAATFTVDTLADDATKVACTSAPDDCSLRGAIANANSLAGDDVIDFSVVGEIVIDVNGALPDLGGNLSITGPGANRLKVVRSATATTDFRIFRVLSGAHITITAITITGGKAASGGGILNQGGLMINASAVFGNKADNGGGISNSHGNLTINGSTISGNDAIAGSGGGIDTDGTLTVTNSTISGNSASSGGGIGTNGTARLNNSTIADNHAGFGGGGIFNSTLGTLILSSSIVARNSSNLGPDVFGEVDASWSLIGNVSNAALSGINNITGVDAVLGLLQYNGGPTMTHALLPGSPALNTGRVTVITPATDQRGAGFDRVIGMAADIGAFEVQPICAGVPLGAANNLPVGDAPRIVTTGDFNSDGKIDLATANLGNNVSVLIGNGDGTFVPAVNYPTTGIGTNSITTGDLNGDGRIDLATTNFSTDNISVFTGNGDGTFAAAVTLATGDNPNSIATGDFNGDGKTDFAVTNYSPFRISVRLGNGDGTFAAGVNYPVGDSPGSVKTGDFNGDGLVDLVTANVNGDNISVLIGNGDGTFDAAVNYVVGDGPNSVTVGDLNGDGRFDLATTNRNSNNMSVLLGNGDGTFSAAVNYAAGNAPSSVMTGDFNSDGWIDLGVAALNSNYIRVFLGNGDGTFGTTANLAAGTGPISITTGDFNSDGRDDLAAVNLGSDNLSVLLNSCSSNEAPSASDNHYTTDEDTPLNINAPGVLANDSDNDGDTLTAIKVTDPANGIVIVNADGSIVYTPNPNFHGNDSFTYKANDGSLDSNIATVTITVNPDTDEDGVPDSRDNCVSTPNPEKIAFSSSRDGNFEIYSMNANGSSPTRLTNNTGIDQYPAYSPDGSKIVFHSNRDGNFEIYVMNADGTGQTNLTNNPAEDTFPTFSPDGSRIVFTSVRDGNYEVYVMNADGSGQTNLTNNEATDGLPAFSPEGSKIAFLSVRDGNREIYVMNSDGTGQTNLTNNAADDLKPMFSPDGSKILFRSFRDGNFEIYLMNADGTGQTNLTNNAGQDLEPAFSPDGTKIVFDSTRDGDYDIYVMNSNGTSQTNLTNNSGIIDFQASWGPQADRDGDGIGDACDNNTAPVANPDFYSTDEDVPLTVTAPGVLGNDHDGQNDPLTAIEITDDPLGGTVELNADGSFTYTPSPNFNGFDFFTYRASDGSLNSDETRVSIIVNPMNDNPTAVDDDATIGEDSGANAINVLGNDSSLPEQGETLTVTNVTQGAHGSVAITGGGTGISYTPAANYNGSDSFTYTISDGHGGFDTATVAVTVLPVNDAPMVSATPKTQSDVQYSDAIQTVTINAADVETPSSGLSIAFSYTKNGGASAAGLPNGMTLGGTGGAWTVSGTAGVPAGTYVITASVTDSGDGAAAAKTSADTFTIVVTRENAVAAPRVSNPVAMQVGAPGGTANGTTAQLCFDISEIFDGSPGNTSLITSAGVQINAVGGGGSGGMTASSVVFSGGGVGTARVACFTLTLSNSPANAYEVTLVIGGDYYAGSGTTAFLVYDPSAGFASGGGWLINPNTGYRANYGVNVKYLKNGNAQGSILYVEHRPDGDYKVKSTSLNSRGGFAIVPVTGGYEAQIAGKANYVVNDIGTGNYSFIVRMVDKGTPGTNDMFGLQLINPNGQIVNSFTFNPVLLGGGNNQVPKN